MKAAPRIQAFVGYFSEMVRINIANKLVNLRFRLGLISERRQVLTWYILLKDTRRANLYLTNYGFKHGEVDSPQFAQSIRKCRRDTLAYIRRCRGEEVQGRPQ